MGHASRKKKQRAKAADAPKTRRRGHPKLPTMPPIDATPLRRWFAVALVIAVSVFAAYWCTLDNEFLTFDDRKYIYQNEFVVGDGGLSAIWGDISNESATLHYYPLTYSTFWLEHKAVGLSPKERPAKVINVPAHPLYHVTQMVLHALVALMVLLVLRALGVGFRPAVVTAAVFALHPVAVESVAWMAERKNLLSSALFWSSLLAYIQYRRVIRAPQRAAALYTVSLLLFSLALSAKAAALTLAPVLIVTDRVLDGKWSALPSALRSAPFFGLAFAVISVLAAREANIANGWEPMDLGIRPFIAVSAIAHYALKTVLPFDQALIYPKWALSYAEPRYWISLAAVAVAAFVVWRKRKWLGDHALWGIAVFLLTISPIIGLKYFIWMQFSFVADHYMYLGTVGLVLSLAIIGDKLLLAEDAPRSRLIAAGVATAVILVGCGVRTSQQADVWQNNVTLWKHNTEVVPDTFLAHFNLGNHYWRTRDYETALGHYLDCRRIDPNFIKTSTKVAQCLKRLDRHEEALPAYQEAIAAAERKRPRYLAVHIEHAVYLEHLGQKRLALAAWRRVLKKNPPNPKYALSNIARLKAQLTDADVSSTH